MFQHPRDEDGKFQKACGCSLHISDETEQQSLLRTTSVNDRKCYQKLISDGCIDRQAKYVCRSGLSKSSGKSKTETSNNQSIE